MWTLVLQALLPASGWFTSWHGDSLRLLGGQVIVISFGDDKYSYFPVRLRKGLILLAPSLVMGLTFQVLPFAS